MLGVRDDIASKGEAWAVVWKEEGASFLQSFLMTFGICASLEEAKGKVEQACVYGVPAMKLSPEEFYSRYHVGRFYFLDVCQHVSLLPQKFAHVRELSAGARRGWRAVWDPGRMASGR